MIVLTIEQTAFHVHLRQFSLQGFHVNFSMCWLVFLYRRKGCNAPVFDSNLAYELSQLILMVLNSVDDNDVIQRFTRVHIIPAIDLNPPDNGSSVAAGYRKLNLETNVSCIIKSQAVYMYEQVGNTGVFKQHVTIEDNHWCHFHALKWSFFIS